MITFYRFIWAIWFMIVLLFTIFPVWVVLVIFNHKKEYEKVNFFKSISIIWMNVVFLLVGIKTKFHGRNKIDKEQTYIYVCNHRSFVDIFIMTPFIPQVNKTIGKSNFMKIPIFRTIYASATILVDRQLLTSRQKSYLQMRKTLEDGCSMCIYPEGTRNTTNNPLLPFQQGAFKLASELGVNIIPVVIHNSDKAFNSKNFSASPTCVEVYFLDEVKVHKGEPPNNLKQRVWDIMASKYVEISKSKNC